MFARYIIPGLVLVAGCAGNSAPGIEQADQADRLDIVTVLVPKEDIPAGTKLDASMFITKPFAKDAIRANTIVEVGQLKGQVPWRRLPANLPVVTTDLHSNFGHMRELQPGYRAVTLRVGKDDSLPLPLRPGMYMDVLRIGKGKEAGDAKTILQNIRVLAVNDVSSDRELAVAKPTSITLMLTPEQAQLLFAARIEGAIGMLLRKPGDNEIERVP